MIEATNDIHPDVEAQQNAIETMHTVDIMEEEERLRVMLANAALDALDLEPNYVLDLEPNVQVVVTTEVRVFIDGVEIECEVTP